MATRRKAPLRPVAAPTDTYVAPALQGPRLNEQSFGALGALSQTLNQFLAAEQGRDIAYYEDAQRKAGDRAMAIDQAAKQGKIAPGLTKILDTDDPVDAANLRALQEAGIDGLDSPYAILMVRKARAISKIREADYEGYLSDPGWFSGFATKVAANPEEFDSLLETRRTEFLQAVGPLSGIAGEAALSELARTEARFRAESRESIRKSRVDSLQVGMANQIDPLSKSLVAAYRKPSDAADSDAEYYTSTVRNEWRQQVDLIGQDAAKANLLKSLEGTLTRDLTTMTQDEIGHVLDAARDAAGLPNEDFEFSQLWLRLVNRADGLQRDRQSKQYEHRNALIGRLDDMIRDAKQSGEIQTPADLEKFLYEGAGNEFINKTAEGFGYSDPYALIGDLRQDILSKPAAVQDSPDVIASLDRALAEKNTDGLKEMIQTYRGMRLITDGTSGDYLIQIAELERNGATGAEYKKASEESLKRAVGSLGDLDPAAAEFLGDLQEEWDIAFEEEFLKAEGSTKSRRYTAAREARKRISESDSWKTIESLQKRGTAEGFFALPEYKQLEAELAEDEKLELAMIKASTEATPDQLQDARERWRSIKARFKALSREQYESLKNDSEVRAAPTVDARNAIILGKMGDKVNEMLRQARGLVPSPTAADAKITSSDVYNGMISAGKPDQLNPKTIKDYIKIDTRDNTAFWNWNTSISEYARVGGWIRESAAAALDGKLPGDFSGTYKNRPGTRSLYDGDQLVLSAQRAQVAAAAKLRGLRSLGAPGLDTSVVGSLKDRMNMNEARDMMKASLIVTGAPLRELATGRIYGVELSEVYKGGQDWRRNFPATKIAAFTNEKDIDMAQEELRQLGGESLLGKFFTRFGLDFEDKGLVDAYLKDQRVLIQQRVSSGGESMVKALMSPPTWDTPDDSLRRAPTWAKQISTERELFLGGN